MIERSDSYNKDITNLTIFQSISIFTKASSNPKIRTREEEEEKDEHESDLPTNKKVSNVGQRIVKGLGRRWSDPDTAQLMVAYARADKIRKGNKWGIQWHSVKDLLPKNTTYPQCSKKIVSLKQNPQKFADLLAIATNNTMPSSSSTSSSSSQKIQPQSDKPIRNQKWTPRENEIILKAIKEGKTWKMLISDFPNRTELALQDRFNDLKQFPQPEIPSETIQWTGPEKQALHTYLEKNRNPITGLTDWSKIRDFELLKGRTPEAIKSMAKRILKNNPKLTTISPNPVPALSQTTLLSPASEETSSASNSLRDMPGFDTLFAAAQSLDD